MAHAADGTPLQATSLRVPDWIRESDIPLRTVQFSERAVEGLNSLVCGEVGDGYGLRFCKDAAHARELITQVLRQDVRGVKQGRNGGAGAGDSRYAFLYSCMFLGLYMQVFNI